MDTHPDDFKDRITKDHSVKLHIMAMTRPTATKQCPETSDSLNAIISVLGRLANEQRRANDKWCFLPLPGFFSATPVTTPLQDISPYASLLGRRRITGCRYKDVNTCDFW